MGSPMHPSTGNDVDDGEFLVRDRHLARAKLGVSQPTQ